MQKQGKPVGIYSACTGNRLVLEACMRHAMETGTVLLIESTANQVDQYGGYTGMKPADFMEMCKELAKEVGMPMERIILGGDHLGPLTFAGYDEEKAMSEARELIRQYVAAGFTKIHIDTSMKVASDDPDTRLADEVIARRGAELAKVAEDTYAELKKQNPEAVHPVYIVGSEVPIPGGSQDAVDQGVQVTKVSDFKATVETFKKAFAEHDVADAWDYVIAVVIMIDGSKLPFEDNIALTRRVTDACHPGGIPVEGELGRVGGKEDDLENADENPYTDPEEARTFVEKTNVDFLAVGIGTSHGVYKGVPRVNVERLSEIRALVDIPLVLHGTSGVPDEQVRDCVSRGICKVNYATDLRIAFTKGVKAYMQENPDAFDPKKYSARGMEEVKAYVMQKMEVVGSIGKAAN